MVLCGRGGRFLLTIILYPNLLLDPNPFNWVVALVVSFMYASEHKVCANVRYPRVHVEGTRVVPHSLDLREIDIHARSVAFTLCNYEGGCMGARSGACRFLS